MRAEIITVGTEILLGEIVNTNAQFLAEECARLGIDVYHQVTCGDNPGRLKAVLETARDRADLCLISGGIGPTPDDITRQVVAQTWEKRLIEKDDLVDIIESSYEDRSLTTTDNAYKQARVPEGALPLINDIGTAPGFLLIDKTCSVAALPGPPSELKKVFSNSLKPIMNEKFSLPEEYLYTTDILTAGTGEAEVASMIDFVLENQSDPTVATYASEGVVRIRLATRSCDEAQARKKFEPVIQDLKNILGTRIFGYDDDSLASVIGELLRENGQTLALAESCSGGLLAKTFTDIPGSSDYFLGTVVSYDNEVKINSLGVPRQEIIENGAVSKEVAAAMASGVRDKMGSNTAISITGVAGPGGGTEEKPVGTVYFGFAGPWGTVARHRKFGGTREKIRKLSTVYAMVQFRELLLES